MKMIVRTNVISLLNNDNQGKISGAKGRYIGQSRHSERSELCWSRNFHGDVWSTCNNYFRCAK